MRLRSANQQARAGLEARRTADFDAVGRHSDLNRALEQPAVVSNVPPDWMHSWGAFDFRKEPEDRVIERAWSIIDLSAHVLNTVEIITELYPNS